MLARVASALGIVFAALATRAPLSLADTPFTVTASTGGASSYVKVTVTRKGVAQPIDAAFLPDLREGDGVDIEFTDYQKPAAGWRFFANVAFIRGNGPPTWLYRTSNEDYPLFSPTDGTPTQKSLHFDYGPPDHVGIPIIFIIPDDRHAGGVDLVRRYVGRYPNDFLTAATSLNDAVDEYSWLQSFIAGLGSGSLDARSGKDNVANLALQLGANPKAIEGCYTPNATKDTVTSCVKAEVAKLNVQTNFTAASEAGFLGAGAGELLSGPPALYIRSLLTVWRLFAERGHDKYEYLPATLQDETPPFRPYATTETFPTPRQLLRSPKAPTFRGIGSTGTVSDVLYFTIGATDSSSSRPIIVRDGTLDVCAVNNNSQGNLVPLPLHLAHASNYVHDAKLVVTPASGGKRVTYPLDQRLTDGLLIDRSFDDGTDAGYIGRLDGLYGSEPLSYGTTNPNIGIAIPRHTSKWTLTDVSDGTGTSIDLVVSSASVACLKSAQLRQGATTVLQFADPVPFAPGQVKLHLAVSAGALVPGAATIVFHQDNPGGAEPDIADPVPYAVLPPSPIVAAASVPTIYARDRYLLLKGSRLDNVGAVVLGSVVFSKVGSTNTAAQACYAGAQIPDTPEQNISGQLLVGKDGLRGQIFPLHIAPARPMVSPSIRVVPAKATFFSIDTIEAELTSPDANLPDNYLIGIRKLPAHYSPCDGMTAGTTTSQVVVPKAQSRRNSPETIDVILQSGPILTDDLAFGRIQLAVIDDITKASSDWITIPGTFVRAPSISGIECPSKDLTVPCKMKGTGLTSINAVKDATGGFAPLQPCDSSDLTRTCILVPQLTHYSFQLKDGLVVFDMPDNLITRK